MLGSKDLHCTIIHGVVVVTISVGSIFQNNAEIKNENLK